MTDRQGGSSRPAPSADEEFPGTSLDEIAAQLLATRQELAARGRLNKKGLADLRESLLAAQPAGDGAAAG